MSYFLDLVRAVGARTCDECCAGHCDQRLHRMEAARYLGCVLADRALCDRFFQAALQTHYPNAMNADREETP